MRHHNQNRKLGRVRKQRKALLNSLARSLVLRGKITTTEPKAKELRPLAERLITYGKKGTLAGEKMATLIVVKTGAKKIKDDFAKKYEKRSGGYVRIVKSGRRTSDGAKMAVIEFI